MCIIYLYIQGCTYIFFRRGSKICIVILINIDFLFSRSIILDKKMYNLMYRVINTFREGGPDLMDSLQIRPCMYLG